jgi:hypothetical protein
LVVSYTKKNFSAYKKSYANHWKIPNHNIINLIKNENILRALIAPISKSHPPSQRNECGVFFCFNCEKSSHITKKCRSMSIPCPNPMIIKIIN